jgi:glycosyltransferase involved in cell wall biosynthesis
VSRHLALFLPSLAGGGAERITLFLAEELVRREIRVDLVLARRSGEYASRIPEGVDVHDLGTGNALRSVPSLANYLRRHRPEALLSALHNANLAALWARKLARSPVRIGISIRNHISSEHANARTWKGRAILPLARACYPGADVIACVSEGIADDLARVLGVARDRVHAIHNPAVPRDLDERVREEPAHPWLATAGPPVVLGVGRLIPQKDFPTLLHAFRLLRGRRPARLVILGEGPERSALEALARELGIEKDVSLPGFLDNPYAAMARASVFALSSRWEGFGNVVVEALAAGTPVVSTDCPSGPSEILAGGRFGALVPPGDPDALAAALEQSLDAPPPPDVLRGRAGEFRVEHAAERYLSLLFPPK